MFHMKTASVRDLRRDFARVHAWLQAGEELAITRRRQAIDWTDVLRLAEKLGAAYNETIGCRSADLFHMAAAKEIGCDTFLTFGDKQTAIAEVAGLALNT